MMLRASSLLPALCLPSPSLKMCASVIDDFHEWADTHDVDRTVSIGQSRFGGRGLFTTRAVAAGATLLAVPEELCFAVPRSCASSEEHWATRLALRLEQLSTSQSPPPYVWALPTAAPNVLHNWDGVALAELQNETLANEAMLWRETRREQFDLVKDRIRDEQRFNYLYDLVQSRIIGARGDRRYAEQGGTLRLVPLIDIAQHSPYGGEFAFRNGRMVLQAAKPMAKGSECFMDYGARTNDEFALQYGFVPDRNPHDQLTIACGAKGRTRNVRWDQTRDADPELREACASLLSRMPTTLGEDVQILREDSGESTERSIALNYRIAKKQVRRCKLQRRMWLSPQTRSCATSQRCLTRFCPCLLSRCAHLPLLFLSHCSFFIWSSLHHHVALLPAHSCCTRSLVNLLRVLPLPLSPFELIEANNYRTVVGGVYRAVVSVRLGCVGYDMIDRFVLPQSSPSCGSSRVLWRGALAERSARRDLFFSGTSAAWTWRLTGFRASRARLCQCS